MVTGFKGTVDLQEIVDFSHSMMSWNLTSKKSSTPTEYGFGSYCHVFSPTNLKKIRFRSPGEKNHETSGATESDFFEIGR